MVRVGGLQVPSTESYAEKKVVRAKRSSSTDTKECRYGEAVGLEPILEQRLIHRCEETGGVCDRELRLSQHIDTKTRKA